MMLFEKVFSEFQICCCFADGVFWAAFYDTFQLILCLNRNRSLSDDAQTLSLTERKWGGENEEKKSH